MTAEGSVPTASRLPLDAFVVASGQDFYALNHADRVRWLAFYLHEHASQEAFSVADLRRCYEALHIDEPQAGFGSFVQAMLRRKPAEALRVGDLYKLSGHLRAGFRKRVSAQNPHAVSVTAALLALPATLSDFAQQKYLEEALVCYRHGAFRAAIVMAWNLGYDRLCNWVFKNRVDEFNRQAPIRHPSVKIVVKRREDFAEIGELKVLEICKSAAIISPNLFNTLDGKLKERNTMAHPSEIVVTTLKAESYIVELVSNVVQHFP